MARSLQRSKGIPDSDFRVFVGADMVESYQKVLILAPQTSLGRGSVENSIY